MSNFFRSRDFLSSRLSFVLAILLYLSLALSGIHYGLPVENHPLSFNCDETTWLEALSHLNPKQGKWNPHPQLQHPTLYLEAYAATVAILAKAGWIPSTKIKNGFEPIRNNSAAFIWPRAILQVLFGVILLIAVWRIASILFGASAAGISVLLLAVTPSLIGASHFSQANLPVASLAFLALGAMLIHEHKGGDERRWFYIATFLTGFAASAKYSAAPLALPLAYLCLRQREDRWRMMAGGIL